MSNEKVDKKVVEVEARLFQLEKKLDALMTIIMQEFSADFEDDGDEGAALILPDELRNTRVFDFKQDSEFN